ncbi:hypothetical protein ACFQZ0_15665 [Streptomyces erythrogriseus]
MTRSDVYEDGARQDGAPRRSGPPEEGRPEERAPPRAATATGDRAADGHGAPCAGRRRPWRC